MRVATTQRRIAKSQAGICEMGKPQDAGISLKQSQENERQKKAAY